MRSEQEVREALAHAKGKLEGLDEARTLLGQENARRSRNGSVALANEESFAAINKSVAEVRVTTLVWMLEGQDIVVPAATSRRISLSQEQE